MGHDVLVSVVTRLWNGRPTNRNGFPCHSNRSVQKDEGPFHQQIGFKLKKKPVKCYIWSKTFYGAETWTLRKLNQKYLGSLNVMLEKDDECQLHGLGEK
jgi:hypothetical protein